MKTKQFRNQSLENLPSSLGLSMTLFFPHVIITSDSLHPGHWSSTWDIYCGHPAELPYIDLLGLWPGTMKVWEETGLACFDKSMQTILVHMLAENNIFKWVRLGVTTLVSGN